MAEDTWKGCTPDGNPPVIGETYKVVSRRKGTFFGRAVSIYGPFVELEITSGRAGAMLDYNDRDKGERISCRNSLCRMELTQR